MPSVPREKYPEMNWRAADKVAAWKLFKQQMNVIFVADQIPEERQWALILVAGGDEAYNCWDTLEETVQDRKKVDQVWDAFKKSFEQSTSFWHFRDAYLADFRQDESETTADLDLRIKQTVRGCQCVMVVVSAIRARARINNIKANSVILRLLFSFSFHLKRREIKLRCRSNMPQPDSQRIILISNELQNIYLELFQIEFQ